MTTDLIATQNKIADLNKKARELASNVKYHASELKALAAGKYDHLNDAAGFKAYNQPRHTAELAKFEAALAEVQAKIATLEAARAPVASLPHSTLLTYFKGNSRDAARGGLELLALCLKADSWVPGASRRIQSVLAPAKAAAQTRADYKAGTGFLRALFARWDATRPAPTFTNLGTSPTVKATLTSLEAVNVDVCPIEYKTVEAIDEKGRKIFKTIVILRWPAGTKHGTSRYNQTCNNLQCQACGHAIKNGFNWVPLLLTAANGDLKSLWVGRDCAKTLFGIELTGELEIEGGKQ